MKFGICVKYSEIRSAAALGFDYIELPGGTTAAMSETEFKAHLAGIRQVGIECLGFNAAVPPEVSICGADFDRNRVKEYAKILFARGAELGVKNVGVGSPRSRADIRVFSEGEAWKQAREFMVLMCEQAAQYSVSVLWETLSSVETSFGISMEKGLNAIVLPLIAGGIENTGMLADIYHMNNNGETADTLSSCLPYIRHSHIEGNSRQSRGYPDEAMLCKAGDILSLLYSKNSNLSIEAFDGSIDTDGAPCLKALRDFVPINL